MMNWLGSEASSLSYLVYWFIGLKLLKVMLTSSFIYFYNLPKIVRDVPIIVRSQSENRPKIGWKKFICFDSIIGFGVNHDRGKGI